KSLGNQPFRRQIFRVEGSTRWVGVATRWGKGQGWPGGGGGGSGGGAVAFGGSWTTGGGVFVTGLASGRAPGSPPTGGVVWAGAVRPSTSSWEAGRVPSRRRKFSAPGGGSVTISDF